MIIAQHKTEVYNVEQEHMNGKTSNEKLNIEQKAIVDEVLHA